MKNRAFTLIELLVVIAIIALLIGILLPALGEARRAGKLAICTSDNRQLGVAQNSYTSDFEDRIANFNWQGGTNPSIYPDLNAQVSRGDDVRAAAAQAVEILRERADRPDIAFIGGWIPHVLYSHLVLQDYLASRLPEKLVACPEDRNRLLWQTEPYAYDNGEFIPNPGDGSNPMKRWPYSSSYQFVPATYDLLQSASIEAPSGPAVSNRINQGGSHRSYATPGGARLGDQKMTTVEFTAQKVMLHDSHSRHFGVRQTYYAHSEARVPTTQFDGSVQILATPDTNDGWDPWNPRSDRGKYFLYRPETDGALAWEPPADDPENGDVVVGYYRWTRGGLKGVDFGGSEINSGQN
ncbi:MAG: prepilin-type N-terminal cleavage/methylation domain-containing protein [Phycisphaerales bacterium]|nr:prepilin-type N-terminal cleavage/methylation domain-containing protein [Phycisphaerales bacterium]